MGRTLLSMEGEVSGDLNEIEETKDYLTIILLDF